MLRRPLLENPDRAATIRRPSMPLTPHLAPPLSSVGADDVDGLAALAAEQQARVAVVTQLGQWPWVGGVPAITSSFVALYGVIAFMVLVPVALFVAAVHQGTWLLVLLVLTAIMPLPFWCWVQPRRALAQRRLRRSRLVPCAVIDAEPHYRDPASDKISGLLCVLAPGGWNGDAQSLVTLARRLQQWRDGGELPADAAACAGMLRGPLADADGRRAALPASLVGRGDLELARLNQRWELPAEMRGTDLLFALVDPQQRGADSARAVSESLWGEAGQGLAALFCKRAVTP
jgi:hypothetical protein